MDNFHQFALGRLQFKSYTNFRTNFDLQQLESHHVSVTLLLIKPLQTLRFAAVIKLQLFHHSSNFLALHYSFYSWKLYFLNNTNCLVSSSSYSLIPIRRVNLSFSLHMNTYWISVAKFEIIQSEFSTYYLNNQLDEMYHGLWLFIVLVLGMNPNV